MQRKNENMDPKYTVKRFDYVCADLKPIQMSPAGNLILNTIAKIWNLKTQNTEDGVAGLMEKETGVE